MIGALLLGLVAGFIGRALVPNDVFQVAEIPRRGASYQRQRAVAADHDGDLVAVVDAVVGELRDSLDGGWPVPAAAVSAPPGSGAQRG